MKLPVLLSAVVAACLAEEAKVLPLAYAGYPYAGLHAAYPYALPAPAKVEVKTVEAPALTYAAAPALTYAAAAPVAAAPVAYAAAAPVIAAAPYTAGSQFHAQDEFGNLNYGYANINSAKQEVGNTYGGASGALQQVQYIADGAGFRVADSRLPVAPVYDGVAPTFNPELPVAPVDTPEVAEAKAAHLAAVAAAAAPAERKRREAGFAYGFGTYHPTQAVYGYAGFPYAYGLPYSG